MKIKARYSAEVTMNALRLIAIERDSCQRKVLHFGILVLLSVLFLIAGPARATEGAPHVRDLLKRDSWKGDFDGIKERRIIRALVTFSKTNYFLDKMTQRGITYELLKQSP